MRGDAREATVLPLIRIHVARSERLVAYTVLVILMLLLQFRGPIVIGVEAATMGNAFRFSDLLPVAQSCAGQLNGDVTVRLRVLRLIDGLLSGFVIAEGRVLAGLRRQPAAAVRCTLLWGYSRPTASTAVLRRHIAARSWRRQQAGVAVPAATILKTLILVEVHTADFHRITLLLLVVLVLVLLLLCEDLLLLLLLLRLLLNDDLLLLLRLQLFTIGARQRRQGHYRRDGSATSKQGCHRCCE